MNSDVLGMETNNKSNRAIDQSFVQKIEFLEIIKFVKKKFLIDSTNAMIWIIVANLQ